MIKSDVTWIVRNMSDVVAQLERNFEDELGNDNDEYGFVGRVEEKAKLLEVIRGKKKRLIQVCGLKETGKSRLVLHALKDLKQDDASIRVCYISFKNKDMFTLSEQQDSNVLDDLLQLDTINKNVALLFDDCDDILSNENQKNLFQSTVISLTTKCRNLSVIFTTTNQIRFVKKVFVSMEIGCLSPDDSLRLLLEVIEDLEPDPDDIYLKAISTVLGGIPRALMLAGSELLEQIFTYEDMLELVISHMSNILSIEEYPADDRIGDTMRAVSEQTGEHEHALNQCMSGSEFTAEESLKAASTYNQETPAVHKLKKLLPLVRKGFVGTTNMASERTFTLNHLLREYIALKNDDTEVLQKINREKAETVGLETSGNLLDQRTLAERILMLGTKRFKTVSGGDTDSSDDSGTVDDMDNSEEYNDLSPSVRLASASNVRDVPSDEFGRLSVSAADNPSGSNERMRTNTSGSTDGGNDVDVRRSIECRTQSLSGPPALQLGQNDASQNIIINGIDIEEPNIVWADSRPCSTDSLGSLHTRGVTQTNGSNINNHLSTDVDSVEDNVRKDSGKVSARGPPAECYTPPSSREGSRSGSPEFGDIAGAPGRRTADRLTRQPSEHDDNLSENLNTGEEKYLLVNKIGNI